jgi:hypothetical protein
VLTNSTTVTANRTAAGGSSSRQTWQVIEFAQ